MDQNCIFKINTGSGHPKSSRVCSVRTCIIGSGHVSNCNFDPFLREKGWTVPWTKIALPTQIQHLILNFFTLFLGPKYLVSSFKHIHFEFRPILIYAVIDIMTSLPMSIELKNLLALISSRTIFVYFIKMII